MSMTTVRLRRNGPLRRRGRRRARRRLGRRRAAVRAKCRSRCAAAARSANKPFCDGSHRADRVLRRDPTGQRRPRNALKPKSPDALVVRAARRSCAADERRRQRRCPTPAPRPCRASRARRRVPAAPPIAAPFAAPLPPPRMPPITAPMPAPAPILVASSSCVAFALERDRAGGELCCARRAPSRR